MKYEEYIKEREVLIEENSNLVGNVLNDDEKKVDLLLKEYKESIKAEVDDRHLYKMPVLRLESFWNSKLWQFTKDLPKGSDLHVHAGALIPAWKLIDFVCTRQELVVDVRDGHIFNIEEEYDTEYCYNLEYALNNSMISRLELEKMWSLLGLKHNENVWDYFEELFVLHESLEFSLETYYEYYVYAFNYYISNNVTHLEIHALFSDVLERSYEYAKAMRDAYYYVKKDNPGFIVSVICAGLKYSGVDISVPQMYLDNAIKLKEMVKDDFNPLEIHEFIVGFDLFNEEDNSIPLINLAPMLLKCQDEHPEFKLFLHCGESLQAESNNLIDAYLLDAARVGHGMNLYRYPKLLQKYAERELCLESCLISNQSLRYVKDLRLHPGFEYLRRGVTIALCSDDPVYQEREALCDDFFAAISCWDLNLSDVKQLCINSIMYSAVDSVQKRELMKTWNLTWKEFIKKYLY